MALSLVQKADASSASTTALPIVLSALPTPGNTLILAGGANNSTSTPTGGGVTTWIAVESFGVTSAADLWYGYVDTTPNATINYNLPVAGRAVGKVMEFSGRLRAINHQHASATSVTINPGTLTPIAESVLLVAIGVVFNTISAGPTGGFADQTTVTSASFSMGVGTLVQGPAAAATVTWTCTSSGWDAGIAAFTQDNTPNLLPTASLRPWMPGALRFFALPPLTPDASAASIPPVTGTSDVAFSWLSDVPTVGWVEGSDTPSLLPVLNPTLPGGPFGWFIRPTYPSFDFVPQLVAVTGVAASSFSWLSDVPTTGWVEGSDTPPLLPVLNPMRPFPFWFIQQSGPPPDSVTPTPAVSGAAAVAFGWSTTLAGIIGSGDIPPLMPVLNPTRPGGPFSWMLPPLASFSPDTLPVSVTGVAASVFTWSTSGTGMSLPNVTGTSDVTFTWATAGFTADINAPDQDDVDRRRMKEWYFPNNWTRNDMFRKSFGH